MIMINALQELEAGFPPLIVVARGGISLGSVYAGAKTGAKIGATVGKPGAIIGSIAGGLGGLFTGNFINDQMTPPGGDFYFQPTPPPSTPTDPWDFG